MMAALVSLNGETSTGAGDAITIGQVLGGMKQWRRQNVLHMAVPAASMAGSAVTPQQVMATPSKVAPSSVHQHSAAAARPSPNASFALFAQLEDLTSECATKDGEIRRAKRRCKELEAQLKASTASLADAQTELQQARSAGGEPGCASSSPSAAVEPPVSPAAEAAVQRANARAEETEVMARSVLDSCAQSVERAEKELDGYLDHRLTLRVTAPAPQCIRLMGRATQRE